MSSKKDEINELFSTGLEKFKIPSSEKDWNLLSSKLSWANFWKFHFTGFNAYYLVLFTSLIGISTWLSITNLKLSKEVDTFQDSIQVHNNINKEIISSPDVVYSIDSIQENPVKEEKTIEKNERAKNYKQINDGSVNSKIKDSALIKDDADTTKQLPFVQQADSVKPKIKRVKRVMYVNPKVVIRDTVTIKKTIEN